MPAYEVVPGDTVWGLSRRALTEQLGRRPTNAEILEVVNRVSVPSGNVDLIFPGETINIPVGGSGDDGVRAGGTPVGPGAGDAQYPSDMYPDGPFGPSPRESRPTPAPPGGGPGDRPGERRVTPNPERRFGPGPFGGFDMPQGGYRRFDPGSLGDWGDILMESLRDTGQALPFLIPGAGGMASRATAALPSAGRAALPSATRPALGSGSRGGALVPQPGGAIPRPPGGWQTGGNLRPGQQMFLN